MNELSKREQAKDYLAHFLRPLWEAAGRPWIEATQQECDHLADMLIDAAKEEMNQSPLTGKLLVGGLVPLETKREGGGLTSRRPLAQHPLRKMGANSG